MFEKEIKFITDFSLNKIKKLGAFFTFEQLQSLDLHPAIIRYINSELEYLISLDRKKLLQKSAFDYSNKKIQQYFDAINAEIKKNKSISFEDAKSLVMQAVSFTANYLVRPKWSLTKFIYNEDQLKSVDEIKLSLNYLYYYDYLRNVLLTYIEKKRAVNLSLVDFEIAINKINKELFGVHSEQFIDNALNSMADFFNTGGSGNKISPIYVELYLKEKDLIDQLFRLRRSLPVDTRKQFEPDEIKEIIYTPTKIDKEAEAGVEENVNIEEEIVQPEKADEESDIVSEPDEVAYDEDAVPGETEPGEEPIEIKLGHAEEEADVKEKEEISDEDYFNLDEPESGQMEFETGEAGEEFTKDEIIEEDILNDLESDEDLLEAFDSQLKALEEESSLFVGEDETVSEKIETDDEPAIEEKDAPESEEMPDLFAGTSEQEKYEDADPQIGNYEEETADEEIHLEEEETVDELKPEIPYREKDIFSFLSDKDINKIVSGVFNEDREDFANTMEKISECLNYEEATEILKSVFFSYRVSPYTKDAVTLTNSVSNYFNQA